MQTLFFFKNMRAADEKRLQEYFFTKLPKLERTLAKFPEDGVQVHVKGEYFKKHSAFDVELVLKILGESYVGKEASHLLTKAVDLARDRLDMQIKKHSALVRHAHRSVKARGKMKLRTAVTQE